MGPRRLLQARTAKRRGPETGHLALWANGGTQDCLFTGFRLKTFYGHDLSAEGLSNGNVFEMGEGESISFDHHASAPYENLFTQIQVGDPTRFWYARGREDRGPHSAARTTSTSGKRNEWIEQASTPPNLCRAQLQRRLKPTQARPKPAGSLILVLDRPV